MDVFFSGSYEETVRVGVRLGKSLEKGSVVAMRGGLGAGKTAFVTGLARGLGIDCAVTSPTFALVNEYHGSQNILYHFDMYRVETWEDLYSTGFYDYLNTSAVLAIEWSENIDGALPENSYIVELTATGEQSREIRIWKRNGETCVF